MNESSKRAVSAYELLGRLFLEPIDEGLYAIVSRGDFWGEAFGGNENGLVRRGVADMQEACGGLQALDGAEARERLATEFTSWFVGPERQLVPPWESLYQGDERHLFGPPAEQVRAFMRSVGLHNKRLGQYPEDHLGFELLVLAALEQRGGLNAAERAATAEFMRVHPLELSHTMLRRTQENGDTGSGFYLALLEITAGVLEEDQKKLGA